MKIAIVDTYYLKFLAAYYRAHPNLKFASYQEQLEALLGASFGTSNFYSSHLKSLNVEAIDIIANCRPLQRAWMLEAGLKNGLLDFIIPYQLYKTPMIGSIFSTISPGFLRVITEQIKFYSPDVLYCQDINFFPEESLRELKKHVGLIVGQIASPLPPTAFLKNYDLILTSFPHFVNRIREMGINSEYFRIGFETKILDQIKAVKKNIDVSFVGGLGSKHSNSIELLEYLAKHTPIKFFGYGVNKLSRYSPIRLKHYGERWGIEMYKTLASSFITVNRHINVAENYANNMRLYEATGVGALLVTDAKENLGDLFEVGKEVLAYSDKYEAAELINYHLAHPEVASEIAKLGSRRTLSDHTYLNRMYELKNLLIQYLSNPKC